MTHSETIFVFLELSLIDVSAAVNIITTNNQMVISLGINSFICDDNEFETILHGFTMSLYCQTDKL